MHSKPKFSSRNGLVCINLIKYHPSVPFPLSQYIYEEISEDEYSKIKLMTPNERDIERELCDPMKVRSRIENNRLLTEEERLGWSNVIFVF